MSAMPPIATKAVRGSETSLSAISVLTRRSKEAPLGRTCPGCPNLVNCAPNGITRPNYLLGEADIGAFSNAVELALFYDAKLDVTKIPV